MLQREGWQENGHCVRTMFLCLDVYTSLLGVRVRLYVFLLSWLFSNALSWSIGTRLVTFYPDFDIVPGVVIWMWRSAETNVVSGIQDSWLSSDNPLI